MESKLLKKKMLTFLFVWLIAMFTSSCNLIDLDGGDSHPGYDTVTKRELNKVREEFAKTEENKDGETHRELFLSMSSQLNFVLKNYGNPFLAGLSRDQWIGYFSSWDYEYFPVYSDINYYIENGVAIDQHHFQGYKNNTEDIYGSDLFMYVKTQDGWKILGVSSTITNPDDNTDYTFLSSISASPYEAFSSFENGFNERDSPDFESAFVSGNVSCFRFKNELREAYDDNLHSATAFYRSIPDDIGKIKLKLTKLNIDVYDQLTAVAASHYTVSKGDVVLEKGTMLATLIATPDMGWKISSMVFSISLQAKK